MALHPPLFLCPFAYKIISSYLYYINIRTFLGVFLHLRRQNLRHLAELLQLQLKINK